MGRRQQEAVTPRAFVSAGSQGAAPSCGQILPAALSFPPRDTEEGPSGQPAGSGQEGETRLSVSFHPPNPSAGLTLPPPADLPGGVLGALTSQPSSVPSAVCCKRFCLARCRT